MRFSFDSLNQGCARMSSIESRVSGFVFKILVSKSAHSEETNFGI